MTSFSTPKTGPLTKEYEAGHVRNFGAKKDHFCKACGKLPAWCECGVVDCVGGMTGKHFKGRQSPRVVAR